MYQSELELGKIIEKLKDTAVDPIAAWIFAKCLHVWIYMSVSVFICELIWI